MVLYAYSIFDLILDSTPRCICSSKLDPIASRFAQHIFYAKEKVQRGDYWLRDSE